MKHFIKNGLATLFLLLLLLGGVTIHTIIQVQSYGKLINYVGIVRGATQRLVKLELEDQPNDELIQYLDGILTELDEGKGDYGLPAPDDGVYQENLKKLQSMWGQMKGHITVHREGEEDKSVLLALSEDYFEQANKTVFAADDYSARQVRLLLGICLMMLAIMLITWLFIFWAANKKMLLLENKNKKLSDLTNRDLLTGAYHMDKFKKEAQKLLELERDEKYAVVYTDFSDFKYINDVFGYDYGDSILTKYGEILLAQLREGEFCGRVSADNFVLMLQYQKKEEIAERQKVADKKIIEFMRNSYDRQSLPTCCGICCVEDVVESLKIEGLLDRANFARKTVKNGKNQNYVYYNESIRNRLREEKRIESKMREALANKEFVVYYQPKVDLKTGKVGGAEALVRWQAEDGTIIPPDHFIPVFEQKFMIDQLDQYVFEEVCRNLRRMIDKGRQVIPVSVNVSRIQFYDQDFVCKYVEMRDRYRIPPELLEIEFTESIAFGNANLLLIIVSSLKQEGFSCSIDDFGKGYSSLSLLKNLPIDVLKIDQFFFEEGDNRERDLAVMQGVIELAQKFNIRTVAEGIESLEQVAYLKKLGCDFIQGYVFYKPMPEACFEELLTIRKSGQSQS